MGLQENIKKRQIWCGDKDKVQHLGLVAQAATGSERVDPCEKRGGWNSVVEVARRLVLMPGSAESREKVAAICMLPMIHWATCELGGQIDSNTRLGK